ncbi:MAG: hypothetical protein KTR15_05280 [Phycisphaeraceae bacterium]|nr:hypothetical protein [Phycisphaeraceae bacterium]
MTKHLTSSKAGRWTLRGLLAASAVGLGVAGVLTQLDRGNPVEAAQVQEQPAGGGLDPLTYSRIEQLRRATGLKNNDLAALGATDAEASAVLTRLVEWCEANEAAVTQARRAVNAAKGDLREQQRLVRIGQASDRQLTDADGKAQAVADAEQAYAGLLGTGAAYAMQAPGMAPGKAAAWQDAAALNGLIDSDLCYLPGMDANRLGWLQGEAERRGVALEQVLSISEQQELRALRERVSAGMPGILVAEAVTLPPPEELRSDAWLLDEAAEAE